MFKSFINRGIASILYACFWFFGFLFGCLMIRYGMRELAIKMCVKREKDKDMEEEIRRMNEMGPNN